MADYYLFIDESGDHGLGNIDPDYPIFTLCSIMCSAESYLDIQLRFNEFKTKYWGKGKTVILHSTDIRKWKKEFVILHNEKVREGFYIDLNKIMTESEYTIMASAVNKPKYISKYGKLSSNLYSISLSNIIERAIFWVDRQKGDDKRLIIYIEMRGGKEDKALKKVFSLIKDRGTNYVSPERITNYNTTINFRDKKSDIAGLQMADLAAYPITRYFMDSNIANPAFDVIEPKIDRGNGKRWGLKITP